jgi:hypothetical protein
MLLALFIGGACASHPREPHEALELALDPQCSFALDLGSELFLVGAAGSVIVRLEGIEALVTGDKLGTRQVIHPSIVSAELFRGDFRGQSWLKPPGGPASPSPRPVGVPLLVSEGTLSMRITEAGSSHGQAASMEISMPTLRAGFTELRWSAPLRLPLRVSLP